MIFILMQKEELSMQDKELPFIQNMFDSIAPKYDLLNRLLSLRQDVVWRRQVVRALNLKKDDLILDAACGTGDVALAVCHAGTPDVRVVGIDFAPQMLTAAKKKVVAAQLGEKIVLLAGDALCLPFLPECFNAVTIAFGIRNIVDKQRALAHFYDALKPDGRLLVLELTTPSTGLLRWAYLFYFQKILPLVGTFFSKHGNAYHYLPDSVLKFPPSEQFARMMGRAGFREVKWKALTFGIATLFVGRKQR